MIMCQEILDWNWIELPLQCRVNAESIKSSNRRGRTQATPLSQSQHSDEPISLVGACLLWHEIHRPLGCSIHRKDLSYSTDKVKWFKSHHSFFVMTRSLGARVAKCHRYGRYICVKILEGLGKKCRRPCSFVKWSSFWVNSTTFDVVLSLNQPYLILFPLEIAIYINFIQFSCQICRDLRTFHGVNFGLKDLLCVKDMTFCNSGSAPNLDFCSTALTATWHFFQSWHSSFAQPGPSSFSSLLWNNWLGRWRGSWPRWRRWRRWRRRRSTTSSPAPMWQSLTESAWVDKHWKKKLKG